jgi:hypothetical protein
MKYVRIYHAPPEEFDAPMLASALGKRKRALHDAAAELQELQNASSSTSSGDEQHSGRSPHRTPGSGRLSGSSRQPQPDNSSTCSSSTDEGQEEDLDSDGEATLRQQQVDLQEEFASSAAEIRAKKQKLEAENAVSLKRLEAIERRLEELREQKQALFKQLKKVCAAGALNHAPHAFKWLVCRACSGRKSGVSCQCIQVVGGPPGNPIRCTNPQRTHSCTAHHHIPAAIFACFGCHTLVVNSAAVGLGL